METTLVPELYVSNLVNSLRFYAALGFTVAYERSKERFAFIERRGAALMLEEPRGRVFLTGQLEALFGRGVNLQITVDNADAMFAGRPDGSTVILPCETRDYCRKTDNVTVRQFVLADPDGYLLRFSQVLEVTPAHPPAMP